MTEFEQVFLMAVALMMVFEGIGPFAFPQRWRQMVNEMSQLPEQVLRVGGLLMITLGMALLFWAKN